MAPASSPYIPINQADFTFSYSPCPTPSQDQVTILTIQESHWLPGLPSALPKSLPLPIFNLHKFKQVPFHKPFRESITYKATFRFFGKVYEAHQLTPHTRLSGLLSQDCLPPTTHPPLSNWKSSE